MKWSEHLYVGDQVKRYADRVRKRLNKGKSDVGHYLITLAENDRDQLDIINTMFLMTDRSRDRLPLVLGIASTRGEALDLVRQMTEDCLNDTGTADLRAYFVGEER